MQCWRSWKNPISCRALSTIKDKKKILLFHFRATASGFWWHCIIIADVMASSFMVWLLIYVFQALHSHDSKKSGVKAKKKIKYINNINTMNKVLGTNLTLSWASQKYSSKQKANTERQLRKYGDIAMKASRHFRHYSVHPLPPKLTFWTGAKDEGCAVSFWNWWWLWWYTEPFIKKTTTYPYDGIRNSGFRAPWLWAWLLCGNSSGREYKKKASVFGYVIGKNIIKIWKEKASNTNNKKEILIWK